MSKTKVSFLKHTLAYSFVVFILAKCETDHRKGTKHEIHNRYQYKESGSYYPSWAHEIIPVFMRFVSVRRYSSMKCDVKYCFFIFYILVFHYGALIYLKSIVAMFFLKCMPASLSLNMPI